MLTKGPIDHIFYENRHGTLFRACGSFVTVTVTATIMLTITITVKVLFTVTMSKLCCFKHT